MKSQRLAAERPRAAASSWASDSARPWDTVTLAPLRARTSLASWLPETQRAVPAATMPITSRSTPGVSGPRSTRSPTKTARRPSGWVAPTARPSASCSSCQPELGQQGAQLGGAAVDVADEVERAGELAAVVPGPLADDLGRGDLVDAAQDVDAAEALLASAGRSDRCRSRRCRETTWLAEVAVRPLPVALDRDVLAGRRARSRRRARRGSWRASPGRLGRPAARWWRRRRSAARVAAGCRRCSGGRRRRRGSRPGRSRRRRPDRGRSRWRPPRSA